MSRLIYGLAGLVRLVLAAPYDPKEASWNININRLQPTILVKSCTNETRDCYFTTRLLCRMAQSPISSKSRQLALSLLLDVSRSMEGWRSDEQRG